MQGNTALTDHHVREAHPPDGPTIEAIIRGCGLFSPEEAEGFAASLPAYFEAAGEGGAHPEGLTWLLAEDCGAAYLSPEPGPGVWNLLFLGVLPQARRRGVATALVAEAERCLGGRGARMLLIDTSTSPAQAAARALYARLGYQAVGEVPDFWGPGDGKLTFRRAL